MATWAGLMEYQIYRPRETDILLMPRASKLLAAEQLRSSLFASVEMHDKTPVAKQCRMENRHLSANVTSYGAQARYHEENKCYTVGKDGYMLVP